MIAGRPLRLLLILAGLVALGGVTAAVFLFRQDGAESVSNTRELFRAINQAGVTCRNYRLEPLTPDPNPELENADCTSDPSGIILVGITVDPTGEPLPAGDPLDLLLFRIIGPNWEIVIFDGDDAKKIAEELDAELIESPLPPGHD